MVKLYINLTNGIEDIPEIERGNYSFIRIQSTWCEQKEWDKVLQDLDYGFLMDLALDNKCIIFDRSKKGESRAIYQGLEFIRYVLNRVWFDKVAKEVWVRKCEVEEYFDICYRGLLKRTMHKLKYFRKFLDCDELNVEVRWSRTKHDGKAEFYRKIMMDIKEEEL